MIKPKAHIANYAMHHSDELVWYKPSDAIMHEPLYGGNDVETLIALVKELIDKTSPICETCYGDDMEDVYTCIRGLINYPQKD